ncbi:MAG: hypothetical protein J1E02_08350 [Coprobacter sp.]|nr:hypothetical protein [Coprobacter sp.]
MKRNVFKSIAVIAAFLIGLSINESCGDTPFDDDNRTTTQSGENSGNASQDIPATGDTEELWQYLRNLTAQFDSLKQETQQLKQENLQQKQESEQLKQESNRQQQEIAQLKTEIDNLKQNGSTSSTSGGEFYVDGLYFSRSGNINSRLKTWHSNATVGGFNYEYTYDSQGRIQSYKNIYNGFTQTNNYNYSGKTVTITQRTEYDPSVYPNQPNTTSTLTYEYY